MAFLTEIISPSSPYISVYCDFPLTFIHKIIKKNMNILFTLTSLSSQYSAMNPPKFFQVWNWLSLTQHVKFLVIIPQRRNLQITRHLQHHYFALSSWQKPSYYFQVLFFFEIYGISSLLFGFCYVILPSVSFFFIFFMWFLSTR